MIGFSLQFTDSDFIKRLIVIDYMQQLHKRFKDLCLYVGVGRIHIGKYLYSNRVHVVIINTFYKNLDKFINCVWN